MPKDRLADGRLLSIYLKFCATPGAITRLIGSKCHMQNENLIWTPALATDDLMRQSGAVIAPANRFAIAPTVHQNVDFLWALERQ